MVGALLVRGMLAGLLAAILTFVFLRIAGEPSVERAIAFEAQAEQVKAEVRRNEAAMKGEPPPVEASETEMVSRPTQAGIGLLTGVAVYNVAFGGLFALVFALGYGRIGAFNARTTAAWLALSGFVAIYAVPSLKYPANPPAVGDAETIRLRTALYFAMIALSLMSMVAAWMLRGRLLARLGAWNAALAGAAAYILVMTLIGAALPSVNEVPEGFPADVLWQFRVATLGAQAIMWVTIGLGFGILAERVLGWHGHARLRAV